ncbi:MAG: hypothetical protein SNJ84_02180 [Verrucomicrobiia bacterium]
MMTSTLLFNYRGNINMPPETFEGNCPRNVAQAAKYSVKRHDGRFGVGLVYHYQGKEIWRPVTHDHPNLVEMVNAIKKNCDMQEGGSFYINEYRQVIVPIRERNASNYFLAGEYRQDLEFEVDGKVLSGKPFSLTGEALNPGDPWDGPRPGIPYVLCAGGEDIRYEIQLDSNRTRVVRLSEQMGPRVAKMVAQPVVNVKGTAGGRFYANEFGCLFTPKITDDGWNYIFIGQLDLNSWFSKPGHTPA